MKGCWLLTGEFGSGKTTFCRELVAGARQRGWTMTGLLSEGVFERGEKIGILAKDIFTEKERPLARHHVLGNAHHALKQIPAPPTGIVLGKWVFDPLTVRWGNDVLTRRKAVGLFVVDELGPLEFRRGEGWASALGAIGSSFYRLAVVVVRPSLVDFAKEQFKVAGVIEPDFPVKEMFKPVS